jgi:hypothetical protein
MLFFARCGWPADDYAGRVFVIAHRLNGMLIVPLMT